MYKVDDLVVYGKNGVCRVVKIGKLEIPIADSNKEYYTLRPIYQHEEIIYAPVDNCKITMRPIMSKTEARHLIDEMPDIDIIPFNNDREREMQYKSVLQTCDCRELVRVIKDLYQRKEKRILEGKKATVIDERYFKQAEEQLYGELAYALEISKDDVGTYITECIKGK